MKSKREQILELCEFKQVNAVNREMYYDRWIEHQTFWNGSKNEHARLMPIITALLDRVEQLEAVLKDLSEPCTRQDYTVGELDRVVIFIARQALKATSPLDKLLEGEQGVSLFKT